MTLECRVVRLFCSPFPHRTVRAIFPHTALQSVIQGPIPYLLSDMGRFDVKLPDFVELFLFNISFLTSSAKYLMRHGSSIVVKVSHLFEVAIYAIIITVARKLLI